jgi:hypothetical protein
VLAIRDIFFGADPDPDPRIRTSDEWIWFRIRIQLRIRLLSSLILRMQKKLIFSHFFLITFPKVHHLQSKKSNFLLKFCVKMIIFRELFQSAQHIYEKREGSGAGSGSAPVTNLTGSGSRRPKNMWILRIRIPNTGLWRSLSAVRTRASPEGEPDLLVSGGILKELAVVAKRRKAASPKGESDPQAAKYRS